MEDRPVRIQLVMVAVSVMGAALITWMELAPDQRMMMTLTVKARLHKMLHRAARRAGYLGMASELRGHHPSTEVGYGVAYRLARLRDRL